MDQGKKGQEYLRNLLPLHKEVMKGDTKTLDALLSPATAASYEKEFDSEGFMTCTWQFYGVKRRWLAT